MKKSILEIYAMTVCFASMAVFAIYLSAGIYNIVRVAAPSLTLPAVMQRQYLSNDEFCNRGDGVNSCYKDDNSGLLPDADITKMRLADYASALETERRDALSFLIGVAIFLPVSLGIFFIHWRIGKKARLAYRGT
ncbi:MAG TPA: hypothetical protein VMV79_07710 [Alphaproteobacteria bacterium]|nr:hypothetical protein [Alphaproteobacteria bacterium]